MSMGPHLVGPFLERFLDGELLRLLEEAIEAACAAKSPYLEAKARRSLAHAAVLLGHWERAQQEIERAVSLAEHHGWTRLHSVRVWLCIRRGQLREARVALARSRDFLQRLLADEGHERLYLDLLEAWLDTEEGAPDDLARAAARLERCAGHPGLGQSPRYRHIHLLRRACLLEAQQDPEAALAAVEEALGVYRESGALIEDTLLEQHVVLARLSAAVGPAGTRLGRAGPCAPGAAPPRPAGGPHALRPAGPARRA